MNSLKIPEGRGFLPKEDPLYCLEGKEFKGFNHLLEHLPYFFETGKIRGVIYTLMPRFDQMDFGRFGPRELTALRRDLAFVAAAFYHARGEKQADFFPRSIAVPLYHLSKQAGVRPTLAYHLYALNNFWRPDPARILTTDNIRIIRRFVSIIDEEWFIIPHVAFEAHGEELLQRMFNAYQAANYDKPWLIYELKRIGVLIQRMYDALAEMRTACHPNVYYKEVRPQIMPFKNVEFTGVGELGYEPQSFIAGETGAQSSVAPSLDAFFSISHEPTFGYDFVKEMRQYMPLEHRAFIESLENMPSIRQKIVELNRPALVEVFNEAVNNFYNFRCLHYQFATDYIFTKTTNQQGTGGTPAAVWLKQMAEETKKALIQ